MTVAAPRFASGRPILTFDERAKALELLGLTPRQARFVLTVALHSGYCLRRQYATFAGLPYGAVVRDFLDGLVERRLARRFQYRAHRGLLYHLQAKPIYRLAEQEDNRHRRQASPPVIARKLMMLDFVLSQPAVDWYATEAEKIAFFTEHYGIPAADLPQRSYPSSDPKVKPTIRYFIHKWPIYVTREPAQDRAQQPPRNPARQLARDPAHELDRDPAREPARVHLVALVLEPFGRVFQQFLFDHARLLNHVPAWTIVAVSPAGGHGLAACRAAFQRFVDPTPWLRGERIAGSHSPDERAGVHPLDQRDLSRYFRTRLAVESGNLGPVPVADLDHYRESRQRLQEPAIETLYARWRTTGDAIFSPANSATDGPAHADDAASLVPRGELLTYELPFTYEQFGDMPGVC